MHVFEEWNPKPGLNVSLLPAGTKLMIETRNSFYELEVVEGKAVRLFGGTARDGSTRFTKPVDAIVLGSNLGSCWLKVDWIGLDMRLELAVEGTHHLNTSRVQSIVVEAADGKWSYAIE